MNYLLGAPLSNSKTSKPNSDRSDATPESSLFLSRPAVRWLASITCGFLAAVVIVNVTLPIIVDFDTPRWFMSMFPVFGGPILWLVFGFAINHIIQRRLNKLRSGQSNT